MSKRKRLHRLSKYIDKYIERSDKASKHNNKLKNKITPQTSGTLNNLSSTKPIYIGREKY